jgi:hypothetical protein
VTGRSTKIFAPQRLRLARALTSIPELAQAPRLSTGSPFTAHPTTHRRMPTLPP